MKIASWFYGGVFLLGLVMIVIGSAPFVRGWWHNAFEAGGNTVYPLDLNAYLQKLANTPQIIADFSSVQFYREPVIMEQLVDYDKIENWFGHKAVTVANSSEESYLLNIPKLEIANALVQVGGGDINHHLLHFNPEVKIGGLGAAVIFGHSTLRQFYNPKESNKNRYKSIFSTIMTLQNGDEIRLNLGEIAYVYTVVGKKEVQPDDDEILSQDLSKRQIKLITCVPEGTFLRRGIVTAELKL